MSAPVEGINRDRRAFLRGDFLTHEGRKKHEQQGQPLGPAPPWHQGQLELERCQACDAPCVDACGPSIIKLHAAEHQLAGLPYLSFEETGCTFCGDCANACPMDLETGTKPVKLGQVSLDKQACLGWNNIFCISCRSHCDYDALSLDQKRRINLDEAACVACGKCLSVCPTQALQFHLTTGNK